MILSHSQKILNELRQSLGRVAVHTRKVNLKSQKKIPIYTVSHHITHKR